MISNYRIWDKRTGEWMNVQEAVISNGEVYETWRDYEDGRALTEDDYVFVPSTELRDQNNVEIFAGCICDCVDGLKNYWYVIEWIYAGWQVVTYKKPHTNIRGISDGINQAYLEPDYSSQLIIIGNIYENPELLGMSK